MYNAPTTLAFTGGAGALALATGLNFLWFVVAVFTLLGAALALARLVPVRTA